MSFPGLLLLAPASACLLSWLGLGAAIPRRFLTGETLLDTVTRIGVGSAVLSLGLFGLGRVGALDHWVVVGITLALAVPGAWLAVTTLARVLSGAPEVPQSHPRRCPRVTPEEPQRNPRGGSTAAPPAEHGGLGPARARSRRARARPRRLDGPADLAGRAALPPRPAEAVAGDRLDRRLVLALRVVQPARDAGALRAGARARRRRRGGRGGRNRRRARVGRRLRARARARRRGRARRGDRLRALLAPGDADLARHVELRRARTRLLLDRRRLACRPLRARARHSEPRRGRAALRRGGWDEVPRARLGRARARAARARRRPCGARTGGRGRARARGPDRSAVVRAEPDRDREPALPAPHRRQVRRGQETRRGSGRGSAPPRRRIRSSVFRSFRSS